MSESNRVRVIYVPEVTYGTTPANSPNWKTLRITSESLGAEPQTQVSNEIRPDRMDADQILMSLQIGGDTAFELSALTFDDMIQAVMCGTWTGNVLKVGTTDRSFTVEKGFLDIGQHIPFRGMRAGQMTLGFAFNSTVTGSFTFAGGGADSAGAASGTSLVGTGTLAAASTTEVLASADISGIELDAATPASPVRSINLTLNNNLRAIEGLGYAAPINQAKGRAAVTGTIESYFDNVALYNKMIGNVAASLEWTATDNAGNAYTFLLPRIKFSSGTPQAGGKDQDVMPTMNFTALFDGTEATSLKITRTVAP